jgi:hypothetical protein
MGEKRNAYRALVGKSEGKRPLGRPRLRWKYNIKMVVRKRNGVVRTEFISIRIGSS